MTDFNKAVGDPDGRRIARRQSEVAEEACKIAECLAMAMRRCGVSDAEANKIAEELRQRSVDLLEKSVGRIESRLTTKITGHPLLEGRGVNSLYLDESGTTSTSTKDSVFALGGV